MHLRDIHLPKTQGHLLTLLGGLYLMRLAARNQIPGPTRCLVPSRALWYYEYTSLDGQNNVIEAT